MNARIATAAHTFHQNSSFLRRAVDGLTDEEWVRRPNEHSNHLLWIVGHVAWARTMLLARLNAPWTESWMGLYGRGKKCEDGPDCPSPQSAMEAWDECCRRLHAAMEEASQELLDTPAVQGPPSADGKLSGIVDFLAFHETYHVGQLAYVRSWLGRGGPMG
jgi:DinB superfamily